MRRYFNAEVAFVGAVLAYALLLGAACAFFPVWAVLTVAGSLTVFGGALAVYIVSIGGDRDDYY